MTTEQQLTTTDSSHKPVSTPSKQKWLRILTGFLGWWLINCLLWSPLVHWFPPGGGIGFVNDYFVYYVFFTIPVNLLLLIICALIRRTRWFALGLLIAMIVNGIIALLIGLLFQAYSLVPFFIEMEGV